MDWLFDATTWRSLFMGEEENTNYTPGPDANKSICMCVWGDHCFMVGDVRAKSEIAQSKAVKPHLRPNAVARVIVKCDDAPSSEWQEWSGTLPPGHFYTSDQARARLHLHSQGFSPSFCPKVQLNGMGSMTCLRFQGTTTHRRLPESLICEQFALGFERVYKRPLIYNGESLAAFPNSVSGSCTTTPTYKKKLSEAHHERIWQRQGRCCNTCGTPRPIGQMWIT